MQLSDVIMTSSLFGHLLHHNQLERTVIKIFDKFH